MFKKPKNLMDKYYQELGAKLKVQRAKKPLSPGVMAVTIAIWCAVVLVVAALINLWFIMPHIRDAYQNAVLAKTKLEQSMVNYQDEQFVEAQANLAQAETLFAQTLTDAQKIRRTPIAYTPYFHGRLADLETVIEAALAMTKTASQLTASSLSVLAVLPDYSLPNYTKLDAKQKAALWRGVVAARPQLALAKEDLAEVKTQLATLKAPEFLKLMQIDLDLINEKLDVFIKAVDEANFYAQVLPSTMGYPRPSRWLIILQNKHELRPTGGFIGSYGVMEVSNGEISKLNTSDSYHLDMPVKDKFKVTPPAPLAKYLKVPNWYFRDSNWSPDWPTAAQKVAWFYKEENKLLPRPASPDQFDFVVAIVPDLIIDLLEITGPIKIDQRIYTKDNFLELLQSTTEKDYGSLGLSSWNRKEDIGRITKLMYERLIANLDSKRPEITNILKNNLDRKNVLVYANDKELANYLQESNWDGAVRQTNDDYLLVVDANLAALKTDAVINRNISYQVEETSQGLMARVVVNYANTGTYTWKTGKYQSYTRVFVPKGSKLIKAAGFFGSEKDLTVGEELGKTYFGAWLEIEPGKIGHLSFDYLLPDNIWQLVRAGNYQLTIQKQPGSNINDLRVRLNFAKAIKSFSPQSLHANLLGKEITWKDDLDFDKNFSLSFY